MKAVRKQFKPVVITIESQDELNYLWHCLVGAPFQTPQESIKENPEIRVSDDFIDWNMWEKVDEIVRPDQQPGIIKR